MVGRGLRSGHVALGCCEDVQSGQSRSSALWRTLATAQMRPLIGRSTLHCPLAPTHCALRHRSSVITCSRPLLSTRSTACPTAALARPSDPVLCSPLPQLPRPAPANTWHPFPTPSPRLTVDRSESTSGATILRARLPRPPATFSLPACSLPSPYRGPSVTDLGCQTAIERA
jgi:hypothetical protein